MGFPTCTLLELFILSCVPYLCWVHVVQNYPEKVIQHNQYLEMGWQNLDKFGSGGCMNPEVGA